MDAKENNISQQEYLKVRKNYDKDISQQTELFDKYILLISTGSFGVSFLFIEKIIKGQIICKWLLIYIWTLFILSIISSLLSFAFSKKALSKAIEEYDKMYNDQNYEYKEPIQNLFTSIFNWYALGFLIVGFLCFLIFGYFNL